MQITAVITPAFVAVYVYQAQTNWQLMQPSDRWEAEAENESMTGCSVLSCWRWKPGLLVKGTHFPK